MKRAKAENVDLRYASDGPRTVDEDDSVSGFSRTSPDFASESFTSISEMNTGSHGFSRLLRAKFHGKWVVLKTLKPRFAANAELQGLLKKEFEIGFSLSHPNIAQTLDFVDVPGYGNCIVMEWVDGSSLKELIDERKLDAPRAVALLKEVVRALDYVHMRQIVHRDVKPSNIMVANIGNVPKIIDFGLSDGSAFHILKQPAGTPRYMAPEAYEPANVDERIDIYSVGIIADELNASLGKGSRVLRRVARQCANPELQRRPRSYGEILWKPSVASRWWPAAVALIAGGALLCFLFIPSPKEAPRALVVEKKAAVDVPVVKTEEEVPVKETDAVVSVKPVPEISIRPDNKPSPDLAAAKADDIENDKKRIERTRRAQDAIRAAIQEIGVRELEETYRRAFKLREEKGAPLTYEEITPMMDDNYARLYRESRKFYDDNGVLFAEAGYDWKKTSLIVDMVKQTASTKDRDKWGGLFR